MKSEKMKGQIKGIFRINHSNMHTYWSIKSTNEFPKYIFFSEKYYLIFSSLDFSCLSAYQPELSYDSRVQLEIITLLYCSDYEGGTGTDKLLEHEIT